MLIDLEQTLDNSESYTQNEYQTLLGQTEEFISSITSIDNIVCELSVKILELIFSQPNKKEKLTFFLDLQKILKRKAKFSAPNLDKLLKEYIQKLPRNIIEDEKRFSDVLFMKLLNGKLILLTELDEIFAGLLSKNASINLQNTIVKLLNSLILEQHVLNPQSMLTMTLLQNIIEAKENVSKELILFLDELKKEKINIFSNPNINFALNKKDNSINLDLQNYINAVTYIFGEYDQQFYEVVIEKFERWLLLSTENQITSYIHDLESSFVSKLDENFKKFFVYVIDICVNRALDSL